MLDKHIFEYLDIVKEVIPALFWLNKKSLAEKQLKELFEVMQIVGTMTKICLGGFIYWMGFFFFAGPQSKNQKAMLHLPGDAKANLKLIPPRADFYT